MARDDGGHWLPIHTGLLRDERFAGQSTKQRGIWVTVFLLLDGEPDPGWFRDSARYIWLLRREGITESDAMKFNETGWIIAESPDSPRLTLRGWHEYTGPSNRKAIHNAARDHASYNAKRTTRRPGSSRLVTRPRLDETRVSSSSDDVARPPAHEGEAGRRGPMKGLKEVLGSFDEIMKGGKVPPTDDAS